MDEEKQVMMDENGKARIYGCSVDDLPKFEQIVRTKLLDYMVEHNKEPYNAVGKDERVRVCWKLADTFCYQNNIPRGFVSGVDYYSKWLHLIVDDDDIDGGESCPHGQISSSFPYTDYTKTCQPSNYQELKMVKGEVDSNYVREKSRLSNDMMVDGGFKCMQDWVNRNIDKFSVDLSGGLQDSDMDLWSEMDLWVRQVNKFPTRFTELQIIDAIKYARKNLAEDGLWKLEHPELVAPTKTTESLTGRIGYRLSPVSWGTSEKKNEEVFL